MMRGSDNNEPCNTRTTTMSKLYEDASHDMLDELRLNFENINVGNVSESVDEVRIYPSDTRVAFVYTAKEIFIILALKIGQFKAGTIIGTQRASSPLYPLQVDFEWQNTLGWSSSTQRK